MNSLTQSSDTWFELQPQDFLSTGRCPRVADWKGRHRVSSSTDWMTFFLLLTLAESVRRVCRGCWQYSTSWMSEWPQRK